MSECHKLMSKYHTLLLLYSNNHLNDSLHYQDELKNLRSQSYLQMKSSIDKLLPQIDQFVETHSNLDIYCYFIMVYMINLILIFY
jgi:hypothetical protein